MDKPTPNPDSRGLRAATDVPVSLERVLLRAAGDPDFKELLLAARAAAIAAARIALAESERALLAAMPRPALERTIERLAPRRQRDRRFLRRVGAAALVGGILVASCDGGNDTALSGGTGPDVDTDTDADTDADAGPDAGE